MPAATQFSGHPPIRLLPDGRKQITRETPVLFPSTGVALLDTDLFKPWGTADGEFPNLRLVDQDVKRVSDNEGDRSLLVQVFAEIPATGEVQVGKLRTSMGSDGREYVVADFIQFSTVPFVRGTIGADEPPGYDGGNAVLDRVTSSDNGAIRTITRYYLQASYTPQQIGDVTAGQAGPTAYVGTLDGAVISSTKWAREWTVRYLVRGDATESGGHWANVSAPRSFGSATGYLTGTSIARKGIAYSIIQYRYNELPDRYVFNRRAQYTFPGSLGLSAGNTPFSIPGVTRETEYEFEETYHVGEVGANVLEFEAYRWANGTVQYTRKSDGVHGYARFNFPGAIGYISISGLNVIFNGVECSLFSGAIASEHLVSGGGQTPPDYPVGKKRISSKPYQWKGDIWKRVNTYITFP